MLFKRSMDISYPALVQLLVDGLEMSMISRYDVLFIHYRNCYDYWALPEYNIFSKGNMKKYALNSFQAYWISTRLCKSVTIVEAHCQSKDFNFVSSGLVSLELSLQWFDLRIL